MLRSNILSRIFKRSPRREQADLPPFPVQQFFVLALCRICEPIALMSIFPYIYFMIQSFGITNDETRIALYAGLVTSSYTFAEFTTGVLWGKISDKVGRKPALLMGMTGTGISMLMFGLSQNLQTALMARALGGFLNGNMGVLQTVVGEIITVKEQQPRAYSLMPFIWCLGSIIGPAMAGLLAQPVEHYPQYFAPNTIFDKYPFLLPNLVCAGVVVFGVIVGLLFLKETHPEKKFRRDYGVEFGEYLIATVKSLFGSLFTRRGSLGLAPEEMSDADYAALEPPYHDDDDLPPEYRTAEGSPRVPHMSKRKEDPVAELALTKEGRGVVKAFNRQVIVVIVAFGLLAYHSIAFDQLMPVLLSMPESETSPQSAFKFIGGFALSTKTIGGMLAIQGIYSMFAQLCLFPALVRRFGTVRTFRAVVTLFPVIYFTTPYLVLLPKPLQMPAAYVTLLLKITMQVVAFPSNAIILRNSVPSLLVLGSVNGVAASVASLSRSLGPAITGLIHSAGLNIGCAGLAWWALGLVAIVAAVESYWIEEIDGENVRPSTCCKDEEVALCDPGQTSTDLDDDTAVLFPDAHRLSFDSIDALDLNSERQPLRDEKLESDRNGV